MIDQKKNLVRMLLEHIVDYAGLFPPAGLSMSQAAANYAEYLNSEYSWMLGKFIVPVARLQEFGVSLVKYHPTNAHPGPWQLSVLAGNDIGADLLRLTQFQNEYQLHIVVDAIELKAASVAEIESAMSYIPDSLETYIEIPINGDPRDFVDAIARTGARAKVRTGGTTQEMFPTSNDLVRFMKRCVDAKVIFKATAGLHHPLRASYRLTYEKDSPTGIMYGFLNVVLSTGFLMQGMSEIEAVKLLEEQDISAIQFQADTIGWHGNWLMISDIVQTRMKGMVSFGSCSFQEPVSDLKSLNIL